MNIISTTTNYDLYITDSSSELFSSWRDKINGPNNSNMHKIDAALGELRDSVDTIESLEFETSGNPAQCHPVEGSPLGVRVSVEPVQEGTGGPSPDNVRAINVPESVTVQRTHKNLLQGMTIGRGIISETGIANTSSSSAMSNKMYVAYSDNNVYTVSGLNGRLRSFVAAYDTQGNFVGRIAGAEHADPIILSKDSFTLGNGTKQNESIAYLILNIYQSAATQGVIAEVDDMMIQLEQGSVATDYEPYQGDDYTVELPEGFAGGTVDLAAGKVTGEWKKHVLTGNEYWGWQDNNVIYTGINSISAGIDRESALCTHYKTTDLLTDKCFMCANSAIYTVLYFKDLEYTSTSNLTAWRAYLTAQYAAGTPVTIYYKLAEPTVTDITPQTIPALAGVNTLTTDGQDMTVTGIKQTETGLMTGEDKAKLNAISETKLSVVDGMICMTYEEEGETA